MYFWNLKSLVADLKSRKIKQSDLFPYLLLAFLFMAMLPLIMPYGDIMGVALLALNIVVTLYCAHLWNQQVGNKDFAVRYFTLSLVTTIRYIVFMIPVLVVFLIIDEFVFYNYGFYIWPLNESNFYTPQDAIFELIILVTYLLYLRSCWFLLKK